MGAKSGGVGFAIDFDGPASDRFVDPQATPALFVTGDEFLRHGHALAALVKEGRIDPSSPVMGLAPQSVNVEIDGFLSSYICGQGVKPDFILGINFGALGKIFGQDGGGQTEEGQE